MIRIEHLKKEYPGVTPLSDVNAVIENGEVISVIGPSGTGKSTLLRMINRLEDPTSGRIFIDDEEITAKDSKVNLLRRKMGMVFQSFNLFSHLNVVENIMAAQVDILGRSRQEAYDRGMELLRTVGLSDKALAFPDELSGGQKQRVAIARALAMDPEIILFDEPTSALDPTMVGEVQTVIQNLAKQNLTLIIVTHELEFARRVSSRIFYMDQGIIYEDGTPEQIFEHPEKERTRDFIRQKKTFSEQIESGRHDFLGTMSSIEEFGRKVVMSQDRIRAAQLVFEELVMQTILPQRGEDLRMHFTMEYAERTGDIVLKFLWNGPQANPLDEMNELSRMIVESKTASVEYTTADEDGYTNRLSANICS